MIRMKILKSCILIIAAVTVASGFMGCDQKSNTLETVTVTPTGQIMAKKSTQQFTANGTFTNGMLLNWTQVVIWSSSDTNIATVDNTAGLNGIVTSTTTTGTAIIRAFDLANNITGTVLVTVADPDSIQIVPPDSYIPVNGIHQFTAIALFSGGVTTQVITNFATWGALSSSSVATITNTYGIAGNGTLVASAVTGTTTITVADPNSNATGSTMITVTSTPLAALTVSPVNQLISVGTTTQFSAVGTFADLTTTPPLSATWAWISSNTAVATIDNYTGLATAYAPGGVTITAVDLITGVTGATTLSVQ
jgi:trimeric autotransporter adhesin